MIANKEEKWQFKTLEHNMKLIEQKVRGVSERTWEGMARFLGRELNQIWKLGSWTNYRKESVYRG